MNLQKKKISLFYFSVNSKAKSITLGLAAWDPANAFQELTKEYQMTTIVITHDMNSVLEIGENILFIEGGVKMWEGNKEEILDVKVKELYDFVYVSKFLQKMKK